ncbi:MAG: nucleoside deaminase [Clostridia bacterium]|nr:nucleoside deaminase [Clostridia bacterium]
MQYAIEQAKRAIDENEVPVGAVVVKDDRIVSKAHNTCNLRNDPLAHAEMLALKDAYSKLETLDGCTLYVTLEPCAMCAGAMLHMRLPRLVFGAFDPACGCCGSRIDLGDHWFDHSIETLGGICEDECAAMLKDFFKDLRFK